MGTQCDIRAEKPIEFCVNCRARKYPSLTTSDHRYFKKFQDIPSTWETESWQITLLSSTLLKSAQCFSEIQIWILSNQLAAKLSHISIKWVNYFTKTLQNIMQECLTKPLLSKSEFFFFKEFTGICIFTLWQTEEPLLILTMNSVCLLDVME